MEVKKPFENGPESFDAVLGKPVSLEGSCATCSLALPTEESGTPGYGLLLPLSRVMQAHCRSYAPLSGAAPLIRCRPFASRERASVVSPFPSRSKASAGRAAAFPLSISNPSGAPGGSPGPGSYSSGVRFP